jgi:hypothetical protein
MKAGRPARRGVALAGDVDAAKEPRQFKHRPERDGGGGDVQGR